MQKNKLSIIDLAKKLNVSKTTVSFILNGKAKERRISDSVVERVKKEALKLGYQPNQFAKGLRTGRTNIIGLMVEDISNPFYASIAKIIEDKVYLNGYKIIYCSTENNKDRGKEFLRMFTTLGVDGCIIAPTMGMENDISEMVEKGNNIVLFDRKFKNRLADVVMVDNKAGMYSAVEHLIQQGFKNIGLVALVLDKPAREDRILGYRQAVADYKMPSYVYPLPFKAQSRDYVEEIKTILTENRKLDAVVFGTNYLGIAGLEAIYKMKLKIPKDIGVVSFDDHDLFRIHRPGVSVVAQPIEELAQTLIDMLLAKLQNTKRREEKAKIINLSTSLIIRESSSRINSNAHRKL
jgi:LacI family transcriptional regulator